MNHIIQALQRGEYGYVAFHAGMNDVRLDAEIDFCIQQNRSDWMTLLVDAQLEENKHSLLANILNHALVRRSDDFIRYASERGASIAQVTSDTWRRVLTKSREVTTSFLHLASCGLEMTLLQPPWTSICEYDAVGCLQGRVFPISTEMYRTAIRFGAEEILDYIETVEEEWTVENCVYVLTRGKTFFYRYVLHHHPTLAEGIFPYIAVRRFSSTDLDALASCIPDFCSRYGDDLFKRVLDHSLGLVQVQWLVEHGVSYHQVDKDGNTALHGNVEVDVFLYLVSLGLSPFIKNVHGEKAIHSPYIRDEWKKVLDALDIPLHYQTKDTFEFLQSNEYVWLCHLMTVRTTPKPRLPAEIWARCVKMAHEVRNASYDDSTDEHEGDDQSYDGADE